MALVTKNYMIALKVRARHGPSNKSQGRIRVDNSYFWMMITFLLKKNTDPVK